MEVMIAA